MRKASTLLAVAVATAPFIILACGGSSGDELFEKQDTPGTGGGTGGAATGGTGGAATGGTGGAATGGTGGGATGGTGGAATGGTGGAATGGTGGAATGGTGGGATGGTGGAATGGTGGAATGGTGGAATGGTGGGATGGTGGAATGGTGGGATGGTGGGATGGTGGGATGGTGGGATGGTGGGATGGTGGAATGGTGGGATGGTGGSVCQPIGHDEDGDSEDDACDNCPSMPNDGQQNSDGDELGERCEDSENHASLDTLTYFEPFVFDNWESGWWLDNEYEVKDDFVEIDDDSCYYCGENAFWQTAVGGDPYSVEVSLTYRSSSYGYAGVVFAFDDTSNGWWGCLFYRTIHSRDLGLWHYPGNGASNVLDEDLAYDVEATNRGSGVLRWIRAYRIGNTFTCEFANEEGDWGRTEPVQTNGPMEGLAGLRVVRCARLLPFLHRLSLEALPSPIGRPPVFGGSGLLFDRANLAFRLSMLRCTILSLTMDAIRLPCGPLRSVRCSPARKTGLMVGAGVW